MDYTIIKTIDWSESKKSLSASAVKCLDQTKNSHPLGFVEFIAGYISVSRKRMCSFLSDFVKNTPLRDVTKDVVQLENACLFKPEHFSALDIIVRYLKLLNTGGKIGVTWAYLDTEEKAIVHFVNRGGWYAEVFFDAKVPSSALHLIAIGDEKHFLPVSFCNITKLRSKLFLSGNLTLQDYFPREVGDFLSKRSAASCSKRARSEKKEFRKTYKRENKRWKDTL